MKTLPLLLVLSTTAFSQVIDSIPQQSGRASKQRSDSYPSYVYHGLMTGVHLSDKPSFELGYGHLFVSEIPKFPDVTSGYAATVEWYPTTSGSILAPKLGVFITCIVDLGVNVLWLTDFQGGNALRIRPEIGIGYREFRSTLGVNIKTYEQGLRPMPTLVFSTNYNVPLKKVRKYEKPKNRRRS